jgi:MSHA biogenesis protein MshJ
MMALWKRLTARVDSFSLRERVLLFACVVVVLGVLTDLIFVEPLVAQQKLVARQIDQKSADAEAQRDKLVAQLRQRDRQRAIVLDAETRKLQAEIDVIEREIAALNTAGEATQVQSILGRVLRRTDRVTLVRVVSAGAEGGAAAIVSANAASAPAPKGGLDITLVGGYLDLMDYLAALERALPNVRWGAVHFKADAVPAQVTVRIVTQAGGT